MTVRTKHGEVGFERVLPIAVDVFDLEGNTPSLCMTFGPSAPLTTLVRKTNFKSSEKCFLTPRALIMRSVIGADLMH